jgi:hypothetical protein
MLAIQHSDPCVVYKSLRNSQVYSQVIMDLVHDAEYLDNRISQSPLPEFRRMCLQCNPCAVKTRLSARNPLTPHALSHPCKLQPMSCGRKPRRNLGKEKGCCGSAHLSITDAHLGPLQWLDPHLSDISAPQDTLLGRLQDQKTKTNSVRRLA